MIRVQRTCASGASAMAVPVWPDLARAGASIAMPRTTSMQARSIRAMSAVDGAASGTALTLSSTATDDGTRQQAEDHLLADPQIGRSADRAICGSADRCRPRQSDDRRVDPPELTPPGQEQGACRRSMLATWSVATSGCGCRIGAGTGCVAVAPRCVTAGHEPAWLRDGRGLRDGRVAERRAGPGRIGKPGRIGQGWPGGRVADCGP